ncbi:MAG: hypothetical protein IKS62_04540 [Aeriscardovia sp.]|nr:hypothetical protein [Aeriscardovia sp.]
MSIDTKKPTPTHSSELGVMRRPESDADRWWKAWIDLERHLRAAQDAGRQDLDGERAVAAKRHRDEEMLRPLLHGREHDDGDDENREEQDGRPGRHAPVGRAARRSAG